MTSENRDFSSHEILICTKDRPSALANAIYSVQSQNHLPARLLIIDSSSGEESHELVAALELESRLPIQYLKCKPGLTRQRNFAITNLLPTTEYVHFIDDDAILFPDYLENMAFAMAQFPSGLGFGGAIVNLPVHKPHYLKCKLNLDCELEGSVLKNGINVLNFSGVSIREVDWISGCCMSFPKKTFQIARFDEERTGNGVGEDVDFCLQIKPFGKIYWNPEARIYHDQSPINRPSQKDHRKAALQHGLKLARDNRGGVTRWRVLMAYRLELLLLFFQEVRSLRAKSAYSFLMEICSKAN